MRSTLTQWSILCHRAMRVFRSDRPSLIMMLVQVPLITVLIALAFYRCMEDNVDADKFARAAHYFHSYKTPYEAQGATVPLYDEIIPKVRAASETDRQLISVPTANQRGAIYFVLVSAAIWFGLIGSCKDIVSEQHVLNRESRACVQILPYLLSKFTVRIAVLVPQMAFMAFPLGIGLLGLTPLACTSLWMVLWLTSCTASALGLAISSVASTVGFALLLVPILIIPQLILGGLLRMPTRATEANPPRVICQQLTIQRWGFEAAIRTDPYAWRDVVAVEFAGWDIAHRYGELNLLRNRSLGLMELLIDKEAVKQKSSVWHQHRPVMVMAIMTILLLTLSWVVLHIRHIGLGFISQAITNRRTRLDR
jgi:hypothetical protein